MEEENFRNSSNISNDNSTVGNDSNGFPYNDDTDIVDESIIVDDNDINYLNNDGVMEVEGEEDGDTVSERNESIVEETNFTKPKRRSFSLTRKKELVLEADLTSPVIVGKKYGIDWRNIKRWKKAFDNNNSITDKVLKFRNNSSSKYRFAGGGRKSKVPSEIDDHMRDFLREHRGKDFSVSVRMLALEYKRMDPTCTDDDVSFHALRQRVHRRINHWDFSIRRKTHVAQLTRHSESVISEFQKYVNWKIRLLDVKPANVYNADQTNVFYSMPSTYTLAQRGAKTVPIKGANSTSRLTVMLCANMEGGKVPPYLIFKGSVKERAPINRELSTKDGHPQNMEYAVQPKAWMDEAKMLDWIERVWKTHIQRQQPDGISYLILDECRTHLTAKVKEAFEKCNTEVDYIPGGYTSKCQMLDVGVNRPFKNNITDEFTRWMIRTGSSKPSRQDVSRWIENAWNTITVDNIKNSWRKVGIICGENDRAEEGEENSYHSENDNDVLA
jgi:DDE superfamily endonuclease